MRALKNTKFNYRDLESSNSDSQQYNHLSLQIVEHKKDHDNMALENPAPGMGQAQNIWRD